MRPNNDAATPIAVIAVLMSVLAFAIALNPPPPPTAPIIVCESGEEMRAGDDLDQYTVWINYRCEDSETQQPVTVRLID
jgi:hypothetical protein